MLAYEPPHWMMQPVDLSKCDFSTDNGNYCNKDMKPLLHDNHFFLDSKVQSN